jgi:hypothetical protein
MSEYERHGVNEEFNRIIRNPSDRSKANTFGPMDKGAVTKDPMMDKFIADSWDIIDELGNLLISKQRDYGPGNINNAYGGPLNGLMVRMGDKWERLKNLLDSGNTPQHESIEDSFKDLANYCIIAMMVQRGKWPENKA